MDEAPSSIVGKIRSLLPLLLVCMIMLGLVMFAVVNIVPPWKAYQELQAESDAGNQAIQTQVAQADASADIAILKHRLETTQTDLAKNADLFMSSEQADAILQKLYAYAKDSNVEIATLQTQHSLDSNPQSAPPTAVPKPPKGATPQPIQIISAYSVRALRITANGVVADLIHFMTRIREISVAGIAINNLTIKNTDAGAILMMDILIYTSSLSDGKAYENLPEVVLPTAIVVAEEPTNVVATPAPDSTAGTTAQADGSTGSITIVAKDTIPPEPPLNPVYTDNFDSGNLNHWKLGAGWILFGETGAKSLQTTDNSGDATFAYDTLDNSAIQVRVMMLSNNIKLTLRQSIAGYYAAVMQPTGQIALYRGSTLVKSTTTNQSSVGRWRVLRLSAVQGIIRVTIDGMEILTARDTSELPPGTFAFSALGRGIIRVDDVQVWSLDTYSSY
jgi:hypothetical protein